MKKILFNIIIFCLSFLAVLFILEFYISYAEIESKSNFELDTIHGKHLKSDARLCYFMEGFMMGNSNHYGYLGPSYPPEKDPSSLRISLVGDSYVEAFQVFDRQSFRKIMESELIGNGISAEVMNFGRSGFTMADMYVYMNNFCPRFKPDIQLVFLHNDDFEKTSYQALLPQLVLNEGELKIENRITSTREYDLYNKTKFFRENSTLLRMVNNGIKLIKQGLFWQILLEKFYPNKKGTSTESQKSVTKNVKNISEINRLVIKSWSEQQDVWLVICDQPAPGTRRLLDEFPVKLINLYEILDAEKQKGRNLNYWPATGKTGHWNYEGHQIIGKYLGKEIQKLDDDSGQNASKP